MKKRLSEIISINSLPNILFKSDHYVLAVALRIEPSEDFFIRF